MQLHELQSSSTRVASAAADFDGQGWGMADLDDVDKVLDEAGLKNPRVREYVHHWAELTGAARVEVVTAADDARLIQEALEAGELLPAGEGRYYSRSYHKDTARSEERTIVATNDPRTRASTTTGARPQRCGRCSRTGCAARCGARRCTSSPT